MKKLNTQQIECALQEMKRLEAEHPRANIFLDMDTGGIGISYPLPKDFWEITKITTNPI